jgi:superfamily II DNA or RNA helicase/HKD family nuclease
MTALPLGVYEDLITNVLERRIKGVDPELVQRSSLDPGDAHDVLSRHIAALTRRALRSLKGDDATILARQIEFTNRIAAAIADAVPAAADADDLVALSHDLLLAVADGQQTPGPIRFPERPAIAFSTSALLVNGRSQPRIGHEVVREMASADHVDLLCAFVMWHGLRIFEESIRSLHARGGTMRVITTTYMGATERRAIDRLVELGASVKVSYETRSTRLHAKAWFFRRSSGLDTGYVGSSNLSRAAMLDGLEWNVRLSNVEQPHLLDTFTATFDEYWADPSFESYDRTRDGERLGAAIASERGSPPGLPITVTALEVRPYPYQGEILDELAAERLLHDRWRNLVVMATGTGKTVVSALDYRNLVDTGTVQSVLFIAHREEILSQSLAVFRQVLRRGDFGELLVGNRKPVDWTHVFASVQSLSQLDLSKLAPGRFDMVIVDEFHHAMAPSYRLLLDHLQPKVLLGLTATPERTDGLDIRHWFDGRTAVELRLWEALERGLLCPFQYFGCHDEVALDGLRWRRGTGYDIGELSNLYTGNDARVRLVLQQVVDKIADPGQMRALGFCVSIDHAEFMARRFSEAGIASRALTSRSTGEDRTHALRALSERRINVLFTVDLFNEGIDLPSIDTVLFLRPTESATIFLQQLGRGLRLADDKPCLTVLDFIGAQNAEFRFDLRYRALTGASRRELEREVVADFPTLPGGCHIELDRVAKDLVLASIRRALRLSWVKLVAELRGLGDISLDSFLGDTGLQLDDLYRTGRGGWVGLRRDAGLELRPVPNGDDQLARALGRMLHTDDPLRLATLREMAGESAGGGHDERDLAHDERLAQMVSLSVFGTDDVSASVELLAERIVHYPARREELVAITDVLWEGLHRITAEVGAFPHLPVRVHARYSRNEALAGFGLQNPHHVREGVKWIEAEQADVFFVTLRKTEEHYSPTTMYADRAISPELFQWESQSTTAEGSATGQRYVHHRDRGSSVHLFIRESKQSDGQLGAPPYIYAGPMDYVDHVGERPMKILWHLRYPLPADVFQAAKVAAG